ncbi:MAG: hypothetical protein A2X18_10710 [Bacteroidetes bacterium GWF2_40_14]|nr:MAG: hypothetical protein A2X18_10710 [Bacteroidetes bacterium GWF2_40_14]
MGPGPLFITLPRTPSMEGALAAVAAIIRELYILFFIYREISVNIITYTPEVNPRLITALQLFL